MRTYRSFKNVFMFEKYLSTINNVNDRISLTRFRTSSHRLQIEAGRYTIPKTPISERICKNCIDNSVEDEIHLLLKCNKFINNNRAELLTPCLNMNQIHVFEVA